MKKTICTLFCFVVVFCIFSVTAVANDFNSKAISAFQKLQKLNDEWGAAFMSGDSAAQKEKGKLLTEHEKIFNNILKSLPEEYCADPQEDLLKEFIKTLINITDEYPSYVFAELYACNPDSVKNEILSLKLEDQRKIIENLDWGFKNITYKMKSLPNYNELKKELKRLKSKIRSKK